MKPMTVLGLAILTAMPLLGAESSPSDVITKATAKLAQQASYSWKATTKFGNFTGTSEGKIQKDGLVGLTLTFGNSSTGNNSTEAFLQDSRGAVKIGNEDWQSLAELAEAAGSEPGPRLFLLRRLQSFKAPAPEAADLAGKTRELKKDGEAYAGEFTQNGAKELLAVGGRRGGNAPEPKNAKGSVKFWVKDGLLARLELKLQGTINFNGEDRDVNRTTTVEIKDVGTTKVNVPEAAQKKLSAAGPEPAKEGTKS